MLGTKSMTTDETKDMPYDYIVVRNAARTYRSMADAIRFGGDELTMDVIKFRVFEKDTNRDVTDERTWLIDRYGYLNCLDMEYRDCPIQHMSDFYYYKIC